MREKQRLQAGIRMICIACHNTAYSNETAAMYRSRDLSPRRHSYTTRPTAARRMQDCMQSPMPCFHGGTCPCLAKPATRAKQAPRPSVHRYSVLKVRLVWVFIRAVMGRGIWLYDDRRTTIARAIKGLHSTAAEFGYTAFAEPRKLRFPATALCRFDCEPHNHHQAGFRFQAATF